MDTTRWARLPWPMLLGLALVLLLAGALGRQIPAGHLINTDELFTAERTREMRFSGPGTVWDNFQPEFRKAPLQYWLTTGTLSLWPSEPEAAVRLPVLLYALGTAWLTEALARMLAPGDRATWTAALAVGIFVTCPLVLIEGSRALLDMGLAFWTTAVLLAMQRARTSPPWWLLAGAAAALGSLQKTPLPTGAMLWVIGLRLFSPAGRTVLRADRRWWLGGVVLAAAGTAFWPLWQAAFHAMPATGAFGLDEAGKLLGDTRLGARPKWIIWERLTLHWSWGTFALLVAGWFALRKVGAWRRDGVAPVGEVASVCFGIIIAATLGGFRSVRYALPAVPGLCGVAAAAVAWLWGESQGRRSGAVTLVLTLFVLGVLPAWHKVQSLPPAAAAQHSLAVALGGWLHPGQAAVLVREPDDEAQPDGVLPEEFYLFYGNLRCPVQSVPRAQWETWQPPAEGALGVCRAVDFARLRERLPEAEERLAREAFVLWQAEPRHPRFPAGD